MAFEVLKSLITQNVRTNGTEAITGAIMQNVLLQMVNALGGWAEGGTSPYATMDWVNTRLLDYATLTALGQKQDLLVSGQNIKTINGNSLLGSGNIVIESGGGGDDYLPLAGGTMTGIIDMTTGNLSYELSATAFAMINKLNGAYRYTQKIYMDAENQTISFLARNGAAIGTVIGFNSVLSDAIIKRGGMASQFLKADGSVDSSVYLTMEAAEEDFLRLMTGGEVKGNVKVTNPDGTYQTLITDQWISMDGSVFFYYLNNVDGIKELKGSVVGANSGLMIGLNDAANDYITLNGRVVGTSFAVTGGTSSQFLKADGSVDSNGYLALSGGTLKGVAGLTPLYIDSPDETARIRMTAFNGGASAITLQKYNSTLGGLETLQSFNEDGIRMLQTDTQDETIKLERETGVVSANSFIKNGSDDNQILLGAGGVRDFRTVCGTWHGVCTTLAATADKTVSMSDFLDFLLYANVTVSVRFTDAINVPNATLNVNGTGARPIFINGSALPYGVVLAGMTATMQYDGTNWNIIGLLGAEQGRISEHAVDLGLPSGTLWADTNIDVEEDDKWAMGTYRFGSYFSWGNQEGYNPLNGSFTGIHDWGTNVDTEPYVSSIGHAVTANLSPQMDMARVHLGAPWRLPSRLDFQELYDNCTWSWQQLSGNYGYWITSNINSNSIFLPAAGCGYGTSLLNAGSYGYYWSSSFYSSALAFTLYFFSGGIYPQLSNGRFNGFSVRAVQ